MKYGLKILSNEIFPFLLQFICPKIGKNRRKFLFYPIGSATLLCIAYGIFYQQLDFIYLFSTTVAVGFTFANLQGLLGKGCCKFMYLAMLTNVISIEVILYIVYTKIIDRYFATH